MNTVIVGLGAVGMRAARQLLSGGEGEHVHVLSRSPARALQRAAGLGRPGAVSVSQLRRTDIGGLIDGADVVVLACPGPVRTLAEASLAAGAHVVSACDDPAVGKELLELDETARRNGLSLVVGAAMAPGLSCLLAAWAATHMSQAFEVHVATFGTGGPACARRRHAALSEPVDEWRDSRWLRRVASSGRELVWFPAGGAADCYRVSRPDGQLLVPALADLRSVTSRAAASRRDRMTSWLPMLRPPHPEGTVGAVRVEVRGERSGVPNAIVVGASGRPALLAGTVAASAAARACAGQLWRGAGGLATLCPIPGDLLAELVERGVRISLFEGVA